jgi:hypothetical protein
MRQVVRASITGDVLTVAHAIAARRGASARAVEDAVRLVASCTTCLDESAWPEVAWRFSGLSTDGCPLQFAFSSRDDRLRYTCEAAGPELATRARLDAAADLIARLGGTRPPARFLHQWRSVQSEHALRWGAWLGVRHDASGTALKLYVEVPRGSRRMTPGIVEPIMPSSCLMMIGYDCATGTEERYFRQPQMDGHELDSFLTFMRAGPRRLAVLEAFTELCGLPVRAALQWMNFGYSVAGPAHDAGRDVVMFVRSRSLGDVPKIRRRLLSYEDRAGRGVSIYRDLFGVMADERLPDHEIVSLIAHEKGEVEMRVGLSALALAELYRP